jgi:hypothetical protein
MGPQYTPSTAADKGQGPKQLPSQILEIAFFGFHTRYIPTARRAALKMDELDDTGVPRVMFVPEHGPIARPGVPRPPAPAVDADDLEWRRTLQKLLDGLVGGLGEGKLQRPPGRPATSTSAAAVRTRVIRPTTGYAAKTAALLASIIRGVNMTHDLGLYPLTLEGVVRASESGRKLLVPAEMDVERSILASAAQTIVTQAGRNAKWEAVALLGSATHEGKRLSTARVAELSGRSTSHVRGAMQRKAAGEAGTFTSLNRPHGATRQAFPDEEKVPHACCTRTHSNNPHAPL